MRFEWDERKNRENIRKHGIDFMDVPLVFNGPMLVSLDEREEYLETDWQRLKTMADEEIDYSDIPPLDDDFFQRAKRRVPDGSQVIVTIQVDPEVFDWFNAQDDGWERRMRAALRIYAEAHTELLVTQAA